MFKSKHKEEKVLEGVDNAKSSYSDEAWTPSELLHEPPLLQVTQPKGSFCTIDTRFAASLDPDGVFDIVTDPNNHRVFKNIKEVTYRKVLEDDGNRQYVEIEQLGRWKFLILSGSFATRVFVEQKRQEKTLKFDLAKQGGMMRKFTGSWKIEPMKASEAASQNLATGAHDSAGSDDDPVVGSWVTFQQVVEPSIKPPWPLSNYIRGITEKIVREMLADLQLECQRRSELRKTSSTSTQPPSVATTTSTQPPSAATTTSTQPPSAATTTSTQPPSAATTTSTQPPSVATTTSTQPPSVATTTSTEPPSVATTTSTQPPSAATTTSTQPPSVATTTSTQPPSAATITSTQPPSVATATSTPENTGQKV